MAIKAKKEKLVVLRVIHNCINWLILYLKTIIAQEKNVSREKGN